VRVLRDWRIKAAIVFGIATATEVAQAFGAPIPGQAFNPFDIVIFGVGVSLAAGLDTLVMAKLLPFQSPRS
jgi:hypothetical protein